MTVRILAAFILSILPALPQVSPSWRFWRAQDGLPGTYTFGVSVAQGEVWGVHGGSPPLLSVNDGYTVRSIAPAHPKSRILAAGRHIWSVSREGVHHLESNVWKRHVIPEFQSNAEASRETGEVALPKTSGEILLLTRKRLWLYEPSTGRTVEIGSSSAHPLGDFNHLIGALDGGVWVSADYGVAKVTAISSPRPRWQTYRTTLPGLRGFRSPHEEAETGLTVTANIVGSPEKAVVQFDGKQWRILDRSTHNTLRGWFAPSNVLWLQRDNSLTMKWGSTEIPVERTDALSGSYNQVVHESPSAFWMATSQGIIRHSQPLWASPAPDAPDEIVNSIAEDRKGRIWFSGDNSLVCLDGSTWRRYRTVGDAGIKVLRTGGLMAAADGKIIFHSSRRSLEALDPETGGTSQVIHPLGRLIHAADRKADGTFQIVSRSSPAGAYFLESFDGHKFTEEQKLGSIPDPYDDIRTVLRASDGSVWLGGSGLPLVRRNETNQLLTAKDGFPASGFHTIFEAERGRILIGDLDVLAAYDGKGWSVLQSGIDRLRRMIRSKDGTLWAASGMGIHRLKNGVWITNDSADGLKSSIANTVFEDSKGRIWAGTARGLFVYNAAADQDAPRTFIPSTGNLRETPTSGDTTLAFSGTDKWKYTDASRLLFSYRLDGGSWSPYRPGSTASFRSLAPGDHRFEVKAMDRNGNADPVGAHFTFVVPVAWYRETAALATLLFSLTTIAGLLLLAFHNYRQLRRAKFVAECASRSKSEFLANMSHEIRTPMNGILGMTELALDEAVSSDQRDYLRTVKESADALMSILNDILDFSKIEAGKIELSPIDFDVHDCVGDCLRLLAVRASEKGVELAVDIESDVPAILFGDAGRVRQVLMNLVGNALKFTEKGAVLVQVGVAERQDSSIILRFMVADTGIGVPPDKQAKIFAPFEQADGSTTRRFGGTGLGLAISVKLVELMKGRIWIESPWKADGRSDGGPGSAFHFTVELDLAAGRKKEIVVEPAALQGRRILVIDDNQTNRRILRSILTKWGMEPVCVDSGPAGIEALREAQRESRPFCVIILDSQMPDVDGFMTAEAIRKDASISATRIVMLTSAGTRGDGLRCMQLGIEGYLLKPAKQYDLYESLCTVLGTQREPVERASLITRHSLREARKHLQILVAEDNLVNQRVAQRMIERLGHSVTLADNGREAVEISEGRRFDVILMDLQMPVLGGLEATAIIREKEKATGTRIPIIALTAHAMKGDRERCLDGGMDGYLSKPLQSAELCHILSTVP